MPIIEANMKLLLVVACALIDINNHVLVTQRPKGKARAGFWEFPGGKIEPLETPEKALIRELKEELAIDVTAKNITPLTFTSHSYDDFHLLMPLYICHQWEGHIVACEHQAMQWRTPKELLTINMLPADKPLLVTLQNIL